jgi:hypothetical protein
VTTINELPESTTLSGGDAFAVYGSNGRTRQIAASDMATYFNAIIKNASISFDTGTSVITLTLGDGTVITGSVT